MRFNLPVCKQFFLILSFIPLVPQPFPFPSPFVHWYSKSWAQFLRWRPSRGVWPTLYMHRFSHADIYKGVFHSPEQEQLHFSALDRHIPRQVACIWNSGRWNTEVVYSSTQRVCQEDSFGLMVVSIRRRKHYWVSKRWFTVNIQI